MDRQAQRRNVSHETFRRFFANSKKINAEPFTFSRNRAIIKTYLCTKSCRMRICIGHGNAQLMKYGVFPMHSEIPHERKKQREYGVCSCQPEGRRGKIHHRGEPRRIFRLPGQARSLRGHRPPGQYHHWSRHQEKNAPRFIV